MMNLVVLDGFTLNPGDLSWDEFKSLGVCLIYDRTRPDQVLARTGTVEIILTNKTVLTRDHIHQLPQLKYIDVLAHSPSAKSGPPFVRFADLETLLRQSDVVSLHCPLTAQTKNLVNAERLAWMKPSAFLLNTSRGLLVDERALADALNTGKIA